MNSEEELQRMFRAERTAQPPALAVEHGLRRLSLDLAANAAPPLVATGPLKLGVSLIPKWLLGGFALGLLGAGAAPSLFAPRSAVTPTAAAPHATASAASAALRSAATSAERRSEVAPDIAGSGRMMSAGEPARGVAGPGGPRSASFDAELKLISFAKSELDARRPDRARAWLREHAERFPSGVFAVEREALLALSDCQRTPPNVTLAKRFAIDHPSSPLLERLERSCEGRAGAKFPNDPALAREPMIEPSAGGKR